MVRTLEDQLKERTRPASDALSKKDEKGRIRCYACGHRCLIREGHAGVCRVRYNERGVLQVPWGYVSSLQCDPIEKKPFFHAYPGSLAVSFGMLGCDFHCAYCQNWVTSQTLRDESASVVPPRDITPSQIVDFAVRSGARSVSSTYNEPLITAEWAADVFKEAKQRGLPGSFVSNGNATPEVLDFLRPWVELYKVDLKSFDDKNYRMLGGKLNTVLDSIEMLVEKGFWVEVVTLVIPGFNDSNEELTLIADFLASVSLDIPWHVTAFHQDYKMTAPDNTPALTLLRAREIGRNKGLKFVYAGNRPGEVGAAENTCCPGCGALLIERYGFHVGRNRLTPEGACPECSQIIPGRWSGGPCPTG